MVLEKIIQLILKEKGEDNKIDPSTITLDTVLTDDLKLDSIDSVNIIIAAEDEYGISISDEELRDVRTIGDLVKVIESKLSKKNK
ncbi:MAG: acyl carrier protein [Acholeplasmatales bacterium]|jgi:acyl carrier protein|nr:acyl carrier protein [Acholeplasmatales bacterium]